MRTLGAFAENHAAQVGVFKTGHGLDKRREALLLVEPPNGADENIPRVQAQLHAAVLPVDYFWTDVGTWDAVATTASVNSDGNAIVGRGLIENGKNILIHSESLLTTVIGCENIVVVTTRDAVLVVRKGDTESVKSLVDRLKAEGFAESDAPLT